MDQIESSTESIQQVDCQGQVFQEYEAGLTSF